MPKMRILAIDGGGIRGVYTAVLIDRLRQELPSLLDNCGLFAGTSTGGILALGLASGRSPAEMAQLYQTNGSKIFDDSWLDDLKDLGGLSGAEYDNVELRKILTSEFGTSTLKGLSPKRVLVSAFDLDNNEKDPKKRQWKPKLFHNFPGSVGVADYECRQILGDRYHRLAPVFDPGTAIKMDDYKRIPELIELGRQVDLADTLKWLKAEWN